MSGYCVGGYCDVFRGVVKWGVFVLFLGMVFLGMFFEGWCLVWVVCVEMVLWLWGCLWVWEIDI